MGLQGQQVTEWLNDGAVNLQQSSLGLRKKKVIKEPCFFLSPIVAVFPETWLQSKFWQLWNMSADMRIHQMCHKGQEMRSRILKLDGLQKSLTITAINHPGTSIFGWKKFSENKKCKTKAHAKKRCHTLDGKGWHVMVRIVSWITEVTVMQRLRATTCPHHRNENTCRSPPVRNRHRDPL